MHLVKSFMEWYRCLPAHCQNCAFALVSTPLKWTTLQVQQIVVIYSLCSLSMGDCVWLLTPHLLSSLPVFPEDSDATPTAHHSKQQPFNSTCLSGSKCHCILPEPAHHDVYADAFRFPPDCPVLHTPGLTHTPEIRYFPVAFALG